MECNGALPCPLTYRGKIVWSVLILRCHQRKLSQKTTFKRVECGSLGSASLDTRIVVVEQTGSAAFNRAKLFNIGFVEALKLDTFDCFIFHDVDLLPLNDYNTYACTHNPRHMYSAVNTFRYNLPYRTIFGGAVAMQRVHFKKVNGFSNNFYGWGAEDDDMYNRITAAGLTFVRFDPRVATYFMLTHQSSRSAPASHGHRQPLEQQGDEAAARHDGLSTLSYQVIDHHTKKLFTRFLVSC
ncbi:Beta-1,4-N-acetylgalactosaminyltransferase bre-4 [Chionoecetes opilio]|uniref:Beta-1,4-N-acetylgalactosaminyltransferase bre-4 n=1 Tax=Chionoecetes opilio TaxID=41210 RepID=A0A8J4YQ27_CHIOP|nr:Beta-1,4-N-acetylgalactosaminyltransferase bre-4 [Chionoecetes opilio]